MALRSAIGGAMSGAGASAALGPWGALGGAALGFLGGLGDDSEDRQNEMFQQAQAAENARYQQGLQFANQGMGFANRAAQLGEEGVQFGKDYWNAQQPGVARLRSMADDSAAKLLATGGRFMSDADRMRTSFRKSLDAYDRGALGLRGYEQDPYVRSEMERMGNVGRATALSAEQAAVTNARRMGMNPDQLRKLMASGAQRNVATTAGLMNTEQREAMERELTNDLRYAQAGIPYMQGVQAYEQAGASMLPQAFNLAQGGLNADLPAAQMRLGAMDPAMKAAGLGVQAAGLGASLAGSGMSSTNTMLRTQSATPQEDPFWVGMGSLGGSFANIEGQKGGMEAWAKRNPFSGMFGGSGAGPTANVAAGLDYTMGRS